MDELIPGVKRNPMETMLSIFVMNMTVFGQIAQWDHVQSAGIEMATVLLVAADMIGNVWEWTYNCFDNTERHGVRGSSYDDFGRGLKTYYRNEADSHLPTHRSRDIGFRLIITLDEVLPRLLTNPPW